MQRAHILTTNRKKAESELENRIRLAALKAHCQWHSSSSKARPPKGFITSPNSVTNWGSKVQMHEPMGDISHLNHHEACGPKPFLASEFSLR